MRISGGSVALVLATCLLTGSWVWVQAQSGETDEDGFIALQPETIAPEEGDEITRVLAGSGDEPGIYVVRNIFPPGVTSRPHSHSEDRYVTVIQGT